MKRTAETEPGTGAAALTQRFLVPRWHDASNHNAQNQNAKALLARFRSPGTTWVGAHYEAPDPAVLSNPAVRLTKLWRRHLWPVSLWLFYQCSGEAVFYPGVHRADVLGLRSSRVLRPQRPVIATLEGLTGTESRDVEYSVWAGHEVYCQRVDAAIQNRVDRVLQMADHVIAISPFLADMGRRRYGDKFSVLPLGIDTSIFFPPVSRGIERLRVLAAGRVESHKRPEFFIEAAKRYPHADFVWFGEGSLRNTLVGKMASERVDNVRFPGALSPNALADEFRRGGVFVLPSRGEGVPKVSQEAAACGLPVVLFGYYEAPSVRDGENGLVAWSDEQFVNHVGMLLSDPALARSMGEAGSRLGRSWDWDVLAPQWEATILDIVRKRHG